MASRTAADRANEMETRFFMGGRKKRRMKETEGREVDE